MKNKLWPILLILFGVAVAAVSLLQAGIMRTIDKVGLLGQDRAEIFDRQALAQEIEKDPWWKCSGEVEVIGSLGYYLSSSAQKTQLGWELGEERIKCGAIEVASGESVMGTYKILRGARYWENNLNRISAEACQMILRRDYATRLATLEGLSRGSAKVAIGKIKDVLNERIMFETERCIDPDVR